MKFSADKIIQDTKLRMLVERLMPFNYLEVNILMIALWIRFGVWCISLKICFSNAKNILFREYFKKREDHRGESNPNILKVIYKHYNYIIIILYLNIYIYILSSLLAYLLSNLDV